MDRDPVVAEAEKRLIHLDPVHFFEFHAWTHDPRPDVLRRYGVANPMLPFLLFDFQKEIVLKTIEDIEQGRDALHEKSRDMGVSWLLCTIFLLFWLKPVAGNDFLLGSRKYEFVDRKGSLDTLFEKVRYNLYLLHPTLMPKGFDSKEHDINGFIVNPETGSYLRGEANNANFSTGGRYKAILLDEFAKWDETDENAWTSTIDATRCRIPVSSAWGMGNKFAQLRFSNAINVYRHHWTGHPLKSAGLYEDHLGKPRSPWYDEECIRRADDPEANIAQELDINYLTSGHPYFDNALMQKRFIELNKETPAAERFELERSGDTITLVPNGAGRIWILDQPDASSSVRKYRYCIACDVAQGLENHDRDAVYVFDRLTGKDVAWFVGHVDTDVLALLLQHFSIMYFDAYVGPENNNHGHAVVQVLKRFDVPMMTEQDFSEYVDTDSVKLGWNTNVKTRPVMFATLREALKKGVDGIREAAFFQEAMAFVTNANGKPEASHGNHDDRVTAQAIKMMLHAWLPAPVRVSTGADHGRGDHNRKVRRMQTEEAYYNAGPGMV